MSLPEATEKLSHGAPSFFVKKLFVMLWPVATVCKDAYRTVAPMKLAAVLDLTED
ncbi:MAG: hypothetical protein QOJ08_151 [Ilumatobacteraceae bacterium]